MSSTDEAELAKKLDELLEANREIPGDSSEESGEGEGSESDPDVE